MSDYICAEPGCAFWALPDSAWCGKHGATPVPDAPVADESTVHVCVWKPANLPATTPGGTMHTWFGGGAWEQCIHCGSIRQSDAPVAQTERRYTYCAEACGRLATETRAGVAGATFAFCAEHAAIWDRVTARTVAGVAAPDGELRERIARLSARMEGENGAYLTRHPHTIQPPWVRELFNEAREVMALLGARNATGEEGDNA